MFLLAVTLYFLLACLISWMVLFPSGREFVLDALKRRQRWQRWERIFPIRRLRLVAVSMRRSFEWHGDVLSSARIGG